MKRILTLLYFILLALSLQSWGFFAHRKINEYAIYSLPVEMAVFFKKNSYILSERAINADKRVHVDSNEAVRHYIDLDRHEDPIDSLMVPWYKIKQRQNQQDILRKGIVPWQVQLTYQKLTQAFIDKNSKRIIHYAADLGHYVADTHVPLHTSSNYNGQFSDQIGIHGLWESRLPELYFNSYNLWVGKPKYVDKVSDMAWQAVLTSHALVDSVLSLEQELSAANLLLFKKAYVLRNHMIHYTYSESFCEQYHNALNGMVERQIRASIKAVSSLWYSAWIDAGQPDLKDLPLREVENQDSSILPH